MDRKSLGVGIGLGMVGLLLLVLVVVLTVAYSGAYNIAATEDHTPFVRWVFTTTMHNSVDDRAADVNSPTEFSQAMVEEGAVQRPARAARRLLPARKEPGGDPPGARGV